MNDNQLQSQVLIGHRGAAALAEENSLSAFDAALSCGLEWIETDIQLTADHIPVISHNSFFRGRRISSANYGDLLKESGERMLSLEVLLETYGDKFNYNLEIKNPDAFPYVCELAKQYMLMDRTLISSFNHRALLKFTAEFDSFRYAPITASRPSNVKIFLKPFSAAGITLLVADADFCDCDMAEEVCNAGVELWLYNINSKEQADEFAEYGVSGIIVDNPKLF